jgi:hypothetical protein
VLVDIYAVVPGSVDERTRGSCSGREGRIDTASSMRSPVVSGSPIALRSDDIPGGSPVAAIHRYAPALG